MCKLPLCKQVEWDTYKKGHTEQKKIKTILPLASTAFATNEPRDTSPDRQEYKVP